MIQLLENDIFEESFIFKYGQLKKIKVLENIPGYTSDKLVEDIKTIFKKSNFKYSYKYIEPFINKGIIIPVVFHKSSLSFMFSKILKNILDFQLFKKEYLIRGVMGYFTGNENKIYLLITSNLNVLTWIKDEKLAYLMTHEMMHYLAYNENKKFYQIWKNVFVNYYIGFFKRLFRSYKITIDDSTWKKIAHDFERKIIPQIYKLETSNNESTIKNVVNLYKREKGAIHKIFKKYLNESDAKDIGLIMNHVFYYVYKAITDSNKLSLLIRQYESLSNIYYALNYAYEDIKFYTEQAEISFNYQELFFLSEISAISINSKNCKMLLDSSLSLIKV